MRLTRTIRNEKSLELESNRQRSIKLIFLFSICCLSNFSTSKVHAGEAQLSAPGLVDDKYSLKADLEALAELRKNIPPEKRKENDEKAFMDQMMDDLSKSPSEIRGKFFSILSKKRDIFSKDMSKIRQDFTNKQHKARDLFIKEQSEARKEFLEKKVSPEERRSFYSDLEGKRKDFYSMQREKRDEFEADIRDKRKNFEDYIRAKTDEFNQRHRDFTKRYEENKRTQADLKRQTTERKKHFDAELEREYKPIREKKAKLLEPNVEGD